VDSLGLLRLVTSIEAEFGIEIRDEDVVIANFGSIGRIAEFVQGARDRA
jgi:acyl carrier protein